MDHQQNYEYSDPNSFGFINTFTGSSDNYLLPQPPSSQQQLNGKPHTHPMTPLQGFDAGNPAPSPYITQQQPMMYVQPEQPPTAQYPMNFHHMVPTQPELSMNSQKDQLFDLGNPPVAVPANIIQQSEPIVAQQSEHQHQPSPLDMIQPSHQPMEPLLTVTESSVEPQTSSENLPDAAATAEKQSPSVFSPEQNNMMKALGVMRKEVLAPICGSKKRRRRILQLNDDDSEDENELEKEMLQISPEKDKEKANEPGDTEDSSPDSESDDPNIDPSALKARSLLKSAVIIHGPDSRKKKKRVLESDEEDEMQTSVDDIGLMESNENENDDDDMFVNDIVVSEPTFDENEKVDVMENPIIDEFRVPAPPPPLKVDQSEEKTEESDAEKKPQIVKQEKEETETGEDTKRIIKTEDGDIDPSMSVEAILENIKPMADDDAFFKANDKSDDSDCQFVSNEEYFGTPDFTKQTLSSRRRGPRPGNRRASRQGSSGRKRANKYEKDFVDGSSESEDTSYSESESSSSDSSCEEVRPRGRPVVKKSPIIVQTKNFSVTRVPIKRKIVKKDRFYDRSRDIPNDVYFGDVNVPLHVLHTRWNSDVESSDSEENQLYKPTMPSRYTSNYPGSSKMSFNPKMSRPSFSYIEQNDDPKLSTLKEFARISGIKINYSRLFDTVRSTDDKCMLIRRILAQKGLQGEPTIAKCKQLRLDLQAKRESAELDKSLIIRTEGRTRRATRNLTASKSSFSSEPSTSSSVQPETLQTLSKIRRVVDSDSE